MDLAASSIPHCGPDVLPLLFRVVLANTEDDQEIAHLHSPPWNVASIPGKGFGAVAAKDLDLGDLLIAERPLCVWPSKLDERQARELFDQLGEREQEAFMDLAPVVAKEVELDEIRSRRAANGFSIALPAVTGHSESDNVAMVFPKISRVNHSCVPNASQVMNASLAPSQTETLPVLTPDRVEQFMTLRMEVFSITRVPEGTEVTIEYQPGMVAMTKAERDAALFESFGFERCLCELCSSSPAAIAKSDERRRGIKELSETLEGASDRAATFAKLERIRVLLEEEGFKGLPAFADAGVSSAFRVYLSLRARAQRENPE